MKYKKLPHELNLAPVREIFGLRIMMTSREQILIENHRGISEYSPEMITVSGPGGSVTVTGSRLCAEAMNKSQLLIRGQISSVEFGGGHEIK